MGRFKELDTEYLYSMDSSEINFDFFQSEYLNDLEFYLQRKIKMLEELLQRLQNHALNDAG